MKNTNKLINIQLQLIIKYFILNLQVLIIFLILILKLNFCPISSMKD